ncbi:hypothetical protein BH23GEM7_BH23GEM7_01050 [soil metagenome]
MLCSYTFGTDGVMPNPYRIPALAMFIVFGAAIAGHVVQPMPAEDETPTLPPLLPAAFANPAELSFADTLYGGETLADLLERSRLAEGDAEVLLQQMRRHQDPRRLKAGSVIAYRTSYVSGSARGIEVRLDADRHLSMLREPDGWAARVEEVPVRADTVVLSGEVESTLAGALAGGEDWGVTAAERKRISEALANRIFSAQVDFRREVGRGTRVHVVYERLLRPDGTSRSGRVLAASLELKNRKHEAFYFRAPDGSEDYYTRRGESLRRVYFRAPLDVRRVSSAFAASRFHPILGINRPHNGVDYAASAGTPVRAVGDGIVRRAERSSGYGNIIELQHSHGYSSRYAHLRGFARGIRPGQRVKQGEVIGYVGMTGLATGPHLHYEFHSGGRPVNPTATRFVPADPLPARYRSHFQELVEIKLAKLHDWEEAQQLALLQRTRQRMSAE